jgi:folate-binding protein YgfZ
LIESYRALREHAALGAIAPRAVIAAGGADRARFLHGLLTNDVAALTPGSGCYAAWLTPQGRMITDVHVLAADDRILLDVPAQLAPDLVPRLDQFLFSEDVQLTDLSSALVAVWIHGPFAAPAVEPILGVSGLASWSAYQHSAAPFGDGLARIVRIDQLGVPGYGIYIDVPRESELRAAFEAGGVPDAHPDAVEAARVEAGYPVFGVDMTEDTIPLEAGIEDRAISFTKGCYVGQEVIVRVLHRGHGRVARRLIGLRLEVMVPRGARILADGREIGAVTSAAQSPRVGPVAIGYVHRDFTAAGTRVAVHTPARPVAAVVSDRPIAPDDR